MAYRDLAEVTGTLVVRGSVPVTADELNVMIFLHRHRGRDEPVHSVDCATETITKQNKTDADEP